MGADDLPQTFVLPAARRLEPLQQGELDGLCGIYSLINAIRLVRADYQPVARGELEALFSFAAYRLAETGDLQDRLLTGVPWPILKRLGHRMVAVASTPGINLEMSIIHRFQVDRLNTMKRTLLEGAPLVAATHRGEHYSVIVGWSPTRARLFDSSSGHWVNLRSLSTALCARVTARC